MFQVVWDNWLITRSKRKFRITKEGNDPDIFRPLEMHVRSHPHKVNGVEVLSAHPAIYLYPPIFFAQTRIPHQTPSPCNQSLSRAPNPSL
jgi:hypothetical protein